MSPRAQLLSWIEADRAQLIAFLSEFVRAKSPNPPGDTRAAAACIRRFLDERQLPYRIAQSHPEMPNVLGSFAGTRAGKHLVLNGHIDTFPTVKESAWSHQPFGGAVAAGKLYGVGANDMKQGTASMIFTYWYLHRLRDHLAGRLTLTCVSDEETFGPHGARHLIDAYPDEVLGDCCLNAEPGAPTTIRIGEKAPLWLRFDVATPGCHGAYTHKSEAATEIAADLIVELEAVTALDVTLPEPVSRAIDAARTEIDRIHLPGAADTMARVSLNIGGFNGGVMANMRPGACVVEADIRLPLGVTKEPVLAKIAEILKRFPQVRITEIESSVPHWSDPAHPLVRHLAANAKAIAGLNAQPIPSLAGTDARLWRQRGGPAFSYGVTATNVAMPDEHVDIEEWIAVVKTHALAALDYLSA